MRRSGPFATDNLGWYQVIPEERVMKALPPVLIVFCGLVFMGCGERAHLIETEPPASELSYFQSELRLHFDRPVTSVQVNDAEAQPMCTPPTRDWQISLREFDTIWLPPGTHPPADVCLTVRYTDDTGRHEADVCNRLPGAVVESPIAELVESDVEDGDIGIDPAPLNANGISLLFSHIVTGIIEIRIENGRPLDWIAEWSKPEKNGYSVTIVPRPGEELVNGTTYVIDVNLSDAPGNKIYAEIRFTTKA